MLCEGTNLSKSKVLLPIIEKKHQPPVHEQHLALGATGVMPSNKLLELLMRAAPDI